jgi:hypothetical protein
MRIERRHESARAGRVGAVDELAEERAVAAVDAVEDAEGEVQRTRRPAVEAVVEHAPSMLGRRYGSFAASPATWTVTVLPVSPGAKLSVPEADA